MKHSMFEILKHSKQYSSCHGLINDHQMNNWKNIPGILIMTVDLISSPAINVTYLGFVA